MKVKQLKEKLQDVLENLEVYDDDAEVKMYTNTYFVSGEYIGTRQGFIPLSEPVEEDEDDYY